MTGARRVAVAALTAVLTLAGCTSGSTSDQPWWGHTSPPTAAGTTQVALPTLSTTPVAATSAPVSAAPAATPRELADQALSEISMRLPPGAISLAVRDESTGDTFAYGTHGGMWTGSVYKLLVLVTLLLQRQGSGSTFSAAELSDITAMIEKSDNAAGYRMYLDAGGSAALAAAARKLGLRHTHIGVADPALTTMDATDGITLLQNLTRPGPLDKQSREFVLDLMRNVQADQRWGVGVVADRHTSVANKNGWMQVGDDNGAGEDDDDRWLVDSVGIAKVHGQQVLISIFTRHNPDRDTGIRLVERLARLITPVVAPRG